MTAGIPTTYRYNAMRSRLEARWGAFFDLLGWQWIYEPLDADGYIPDFLILGGNPFFIEVGPCITQSDFEAKAAKANASAVTLARDVLVVGVSPLPGLISLGIGNLPAGWFGEFWPSSPGDEIFGPSEAVLDWGTGQWIRCGAPACGAFAIHHDVDGYGSRPCGHGDGDHYLGQADPWEIENLWARAGSRVQWKPAA